MLDLFTKATWRKARAESVSAARACKKTLTNPTGFYRYDSADERVAQAMTYWVDRARNAHAIVMGRKPVVGNFVYIGPGGTGSGPVFAEEGGAACR